MKQLSWYDRPVLNKPEGEIETPLGLLKFQVEENYSMHAELSEFVTINSILCRVQINSQLSFAREEWVHHIYVERVEYYSTSYSKEPQWRPSGYATPKARDKAKAAIIPALEQWLENNFEAVEQGKRIADTNLIMRANHRLDTAIEEIEVRRTELKTLQEKLERYGTLEKHDRDFLSDLWSHHWSF